jgi:hypothetical protein
MLHGAKNELAAENHRAMTRPDWDLHFFGA